MKRLVIGIACLAPGALLAYGNDSPDVRPFSVALEPRKVHEECVKLQAGEKRKYYWRADGPVDFNVHYHVDQDVLYPLKRDGMRGDGGTFIARIGQDYCWMWTARDKAVKVEGRIESR